MKRSILGLVLVLPLASCASAEDGRKESSSSPARTTQAASVDKLDTNADGVVSLDEALAFQKIRFNRFDRDHDGVITYAELTFGSNRNLPSNPARFANFDTDRNGTIDRTEFFAPTTKRFRTADRDGNGVLSTEEMRALRAGG